MTIACIPIIAPFTIVHAWISAKSPIDTRFPMYVPWPKLATNRAVLNITVFTNAYFIHITAQLAIIPNLTCGSNFNITNDASCRGDKGGIKDFRGYNTETKKYFQTYVFFLNMLCPEASFH
jgi:hypothetical protein